jgi:SAM-dependent methyltransferase
MDQAAWDERYAGPELVWGAGPNCFVAEELAGLEPGRALDLGTGEGRNAIWLAERGWQVTGVDFSATGLARAAELARRRGVSVDWVQDDLLSYQPVPAGYDLVLIAYIQLPADDLARLVRAAVTALAPGGTLLAVGHDRDNLEKGYGGPQYPHVLWTPALVAAELDGLTVERAEQVQRHVQIAGGERVAIDTLVRAGRPAGIDTAPGDREG